MIIEEIMHIGVHAAVFVAQFALFTVNIWHGKSDGGDISWGWPVSSAVAGILLLLAYAMVHTAKDKDKWTRIEAAIALASLPTGVYWYLFGMTRAHYYCVHYGLVYTALYVARGARDISTKNYPRSAPQAFVMWTSIIVHLAEAPKWAVLATWGVFVYAHTDAVINILLKKDNAKQKLVPGDTVSRFARGPETVYAQTGITSDTIRERVIAQQNHKPVMVF